jgi:hypothetical protein
MLHRLRTSGLRFSRAAFTDVQAGTMCKQGAASVVGPPPWLVCGDEHGSLPEHARGALSEPRWSAGGAQGRMMAMAARKPHQRGRQGAADGPALPAAGDSREAPPWQKALGARRSSAQVACKPRRARFGPQIESSACAIRKRHHLNLSTHPLRTQFGLQTG